MRFFRTNKPPNTGTCAVCNGSMAAEHFNRRYCTACRKQAQLVQQRAVAKVRHAVKTGKLLHPTKHRCYDCDRPAQVYDHRDYAKPIAVEPVCQSCNHKRKQAKWDAKQLQGIYKAFYWCK